MDQTIAISETKSTNPSSLKTVDWSKQFGNDNPLELELGFGRPHFLFERAKVASDRNHVGIEWKQGFVKRATERIFRDDIKNVLVIQGNARYLTALFAPESLTNISINFPDPWWKTKHHKKRLLDTEFAQFLVTRLAPNGTIFFQTDVRMLFDEYSSLFDRAELIRTNSLNAQSHREKKCIAMGIPVYRTIITK